MSNDFKIGEKAVYPAHGVAEVIGIEKKEINTTVCSFYVLKVLATGMQILVPREKADQVGLRAVATSSEIEEVFDILREKDVHIDKQTWNRRYRGFMEKIKTGSLFDVAEVYRDLYRLKSSKVLSFGERKMLDNAKQLIVKELAVELAVPVVYVTHSEREAIGSRNGKGHRWVPSQCFLQRLFRFHTATSTRRGKQVPQKHSTALALNIDG